MKKFLIIFLAVILLFPIPLKLKDGGSVEFRAILYSVTKYHQLNHEVDGGYVDGLGVKIFGVKVLDTRKKLEETIVEERKKLEDLKLYAEGIDTTKLVKFNDELYGRSFGMIDYAGDFTKSIGKINFLVEKEYLPVIDGETNAEEFFEADVLECNGNCLILNVDNEAILFGKIERVDVN